MPEDHEIIISNYLKYIDDIAEIIYDDNRIKGFYDDEPKHQEMTLEERKKAGLSEDINFWNACDERARELKRIYLGNKLMLMVTEIAEAHESIRKPDENGNIKPSEHIPQFNALEEEIADAIIRLLDFAGYNKLRLAQAIKAKLIFNQSRPYRHGKKF
jgi:NTP pyrophosphatase (non-canonical NTP hydrolase)